MIIRRKFLIIIVLLFMMKRISEKEKKSENQIIKRYQYILSYSQNEATNKTMAMLIRVHTRVFHHEKYGYVCA